MDTLMLITSAAITLGVLLLWVLPKTRTLASQLMVCVPVVPLLWVFTTHYQITEIPWLLMGSLLGVDKIGQFFLGLTTILWICSALYGKYYFPKGTQLHIYNFLFLLTMIGNIGLIVSHDISSFLTFYTLMSISAYGLIIHDRKASSIRAGKIYIIMTILGEMLLFLGLSIAAFESNSIVFEEIKNSIAVSPHREWITIIVFCGFGIKLGLMPFHIWLPLAHPAAPTPASAVLSGAMIKTGLLGILRIVPFGIIGMSSLGTAIIVMGFTSAILAALIGATQNNGKSVLAYSSISQMGLVVAALGVGLKFPELWPSILSALLIYIVHHAVAKAALFLGYGVIHSHTKKGFQQITILIGLCISALAIAGLPLTTGYVAKIALKKSMLDSPEAWSSIFTTMLFVSSVTTSIIMIRFLFLVWPKDKDGEDTSHLGMVIPWGFLTSGVVINVGLGLSLSIIQSKWITMDSTYLKGALGPIGIAGVLFVVIFYSKKVQRIAKCCTIPEGDILFIGTYFGTKIKKYTTPKIHTKNSGQNISGIVISIVDSANALVKKTEDQQKNIFYKYLLPLITLMTLLFLMNTNI